MRPFHLSPPNVPGESRDRTGQKKLLTVTKIDKRGGVGTYGSICKQIWWRVAAVSVSGSASCGESAIDFGRSLENLHSHSHLHNDSLMGSHRWKGCSGSFSENLQLRVCCCAHRVCVFPVVTALEFKRLENGHFSTVNYAFGSSVLCFLLEHFWGAGCVSLPVHIWVKRHVGAALSSPSLPLVSLQGKRLPAYLSADAEEGEVSDDDSADEIEDDFKLKSSNVRIVHIDVIANTVWHQIHWFNDDNAAVHNQGRLKTALMGFFLNCWTKGREKISCLHKRHLHLKDHCSVSFLEPVIKLFKGRYSSFIAGKSKHSADVEFQWILLPCICFYSLMR